MIYTINQVKTNFSMQWNVFSNEGNLCEINSPFQTNCFNAHFDFHNGESYRMYYNPFDKSFGKKLEDRLSFKIFDSNDNLVGKFIGRTKKTGKLFGGYAYFELNFNNDQYIGYEVGRGADGISLCLYHDDELLAITDKNTKVVNFHDEYKIYSIDENYLSIVTLFTVYYDMLKFANLGEVKLYSETDTYLITVNKELKAKFDPDFIDRVKSLDKIND